MLDFNTDFCLTNRQDYARSSPGTASLKVLPKTLPGTGSTDQDVFKYCSHVGKFRICTETETVLCWTEER